MKTFYPDNEDVQNNLRYGSTVFVEEGDPERLLDEFHALGYDLAYVNEPLTPALLAKNVA